MKLSKRARLAVLSALALTAIIAGGVWSFQRAGSDRGAAATITASPNPVPIRSGPGRVTISWEARGEDWTEVRVSPDRGPEKLFARGGDAGEAIAAFIVEGHSYDFRLYSQSSPRRALASVRVTQGSPKGMGYKLVTTAVVLLPVAVVFVVGRRRRLSSARLARVGLAVAATAWALLPVLRAPLVPIESQPFPDAPVYADAARQLASGNGYVTVVDERRPDPLFGSRSLPPRFPFGASAALAPFALFDGFPKNVQLGSKAISAGYVVAVVAAAWALAGPMAAAVAAGFVGSSPFAQVSARLVLSDALAAALTVLILLAVVRRSRTWAAVAGALAGAVVDVRLLGVAVLVALVATIGRRHWRTVVVFSLPFLAALFLYQWATFGSPLRTGYDYWLPGARTFGPSYVAQPRTPGRAGVVIPDRLQGSLLSAKCPCPTGGPMTDLPNVAFYASLVGGLFWVYAPPLVTLFGVVQLVRDRAEAAARFVIVQIALTILILLLYFGHDPRLAAPAMATLVVYSAKGFVVTLEGLGRRVKERQWLRPAAPVPEDNLADG